MNSSLRTEQVNAACVFAEQEVEYELRLVIDVLKQRLESVNVPQGSPRIELWQTPFYEVKVGGRLLETN